MVARSMITKFNPLLQLPAPVTVTPSILNKPVEFYNRTINNTVLLISVTYISYLYQLLISVTYINYLYQLLISITYINYLYQLLISITYIDYLYLYIKSNGCSDGGWLLLRTMSLTISSIKYYDTITLFTLILLSM